MSVEVFFCSIADAPVGVVRRCMSELCLSRWSVEKQSFVHILRPNRLSTFQKERRVAADEEADGPFYVLADDDCLPGPGPFLERGVEILERHPEFAILSMLPTNATIVPWRPGPEVVETAEGKEMRCYVPHEDEEVMEHVSVGGIRFCRKGCLESWPEQTGRGYDREHCAALREAGYRVGYFRDLKMNHLGEGYSTVWVSP